MFNAIKSDLPNCPDEVIDVWLVPHAKEKGWPPSPTNGWKYLIGLDFDLDILKKVTWKKEKIEFGPDMLEPKSQWMLDYVSSQHYGTPGGDERVNRCLSYMRQHGIFPKPIVLLRMREEHFIWDGSHRAVAYLLLSGIFRWPDGQIKKENVQELQDAWIARLPP